MEDFTCNCGKEVRCPNCKCIIKKDDKVDKKDTVENQVEIKSMNLND